MSQSKAPKFQNLLPPPMMEMIQTNITAEGNQTLTEQTAAKKHHRKLYASKEQAVESLKGLKQKLNKLKERRAKTNGTKKG
jgi:ribosome-associated translation inhibitor RaiA|tara:strand:+ start:240 stop:482 length:243 start_codon:yes stop_codon:yes gene_type:complete